MYDKLVKELRKAHKTATDRLENPYRFAAYYKAAADAIEELSKPKWISVTEWLPEEMDRSCGGWSAEIRPSDDVLVWLSSEKRQSVAWYSHTYNEWTTVDENTMYCFGEVTHWMPLPEPPKEET